jgi:hypothetical protein
MLQQASNDPAKIAAAVEEQWGQFDQVGAYRAARLEGWTDARGDEIPAGAATTAASPFPTCLPCRGWLCGERPVVCFGDANNDGAPDWRLATHGADFAGETAYEPREGRAALKILDAPEMNGRWDRKDERWIYVGGVTCEGGTDLCGGVTGCARPKVLAAGRDGVFRPVARLRNEYYPYSEKVAPKDCDLGGRNDVTVRYGDSFVHYKKPAK